MAKNRFTMQPKQMGLAMSPSYSHTVSVAGVLSPDDEDDGDICPVCDGECTCNSTNLPLRPPTPPAASPRPVGPLSMEELSRQFTAVTSSSKPSFLAPKQPQKQPPPPSRPSLKIKLALPPSMLAKRHAPSESTSSLSAHRKLRNQDETMFVDGNAGENIAFIGPSSSAGATTPTPAHPYTSSHHAPAPRKRGRPRKIVPASDADSRRESTSPVHRRINPKATIVGRQKQQMYAQKFAKTLKARAPAPKKRNPKKKAVVPRRRRRVDSDPSLSDLTGDDEFGGHSRVYDPDSEDDTASVQFPTFVSASALSSLESGGDGNSSDSSSSLSDFSSDMSIKDEEEDFLVSGMQERDAGRRRDYNNQWVIKARRKSVGLSDGEVEMDSDATEDEDEENEDAHRTITADPEGGYQEEEDGDETDRRQAGAQGDLKGLVTSWSDDESDTFDADVFFANLSSDSESSDDETKESGGMMDDDDGSSSDVSTEAELMHMREELENLPLELAESWDGQLMFTNGTLGGQAIIDIDFEVNASQFVADSDPNDCCKNGQRGSPTHDHCMSYDGVDGDAVMSDVDDGGYEEDAGEGEGDTTDEELVGEDDLPNERAMRLFNFPLSVSAINPLSTVSPAVTRASKRPGRRNFNSSNRLQTPSPADILAGKLAWDSADEMDELFDSAQRGRRLVRGDDIKSERQGGGLAGPRKGVFVPAQETRQVVIDGTHKDIPSPHPRFNRRRPRRFNTMEALLRKHLLSIARNPMSFVPAATVVPDSSPLKLLPSVEISATAASAASGLLTPGAVSQPADDGLTTPIDLDDVFESSFFNPDPTDAPGSNANRSGGSPCDVPPDSTTADESDPNKNEMKHLHRWDVISVGAFRQTRESVGPTGILDSPAAPGWSDHRRTPAPSADYGSVLKASPLSTMLWPSGEKKGSSSRRVIAPTISLAGSPLILPTRGDGDRTPTAHLLNQQQADRNQQQQQQQNNYVPKTRKELRKEKKNKKYGHSPHGNHHPAHHYHSHHHHPNTKSRSSGSTQRTNFLSSVPPLNI